MKARLKADQRRALILKRSKGLFARKGMHGVSVNEIADECQVSPAVLYQHFRSKEALYDEVIDATACARDDYVEAVLSGPTDFANVLYRMTVVFVRNRVADPDSVRIELRTLIDGDAARDKFFANHWKGLIDYVAIGVQELLDAGTIADIDVRVAVLAYVALVREVIVALTLGDTPDEEGGPSLEYYVKGALDIYLRGLKLPSFDW